MGHLVKKAGELIAVISDAGMVSYHLITTCITCYPLSTLRFNSYRPAAKKYLDYRHLPS